MTRNRFNEAKYQSTSTSTSMNNSLQYINEKIQANNKFNNNINIIKDIRNYYEAETDNYNKKLSSFKNYIKVAEITVILLASIATTAATTSVCLNRYRITLFYTNSFCYSNCLWFI